MVEKKLQNMIFMTDHKTMKYDQWLPSTVTDFYSESFLFNQKQTSNNNPVTKIIHQTGSNNFFANINGKIMTVPLSSVFLASTFLLLQDLCVQLPAAGILFFVFTHTLQRRKSYFISCSCRENKVHLHSYFHPDHPIIFQIGHSCETWERTSYFLKQIKSWFHVFHIFGPLKEI